MNGPRGRFITLEGGEGVGKSTQARLLKERLEAAGVECLSTREPGGSPRAEALRRALLSGAVAPLGPAAEALVFTAARIDHLDELIQPALARGAWVICDRFVDSTRVYQGALGDLDAAMINDLETVAVGETMPDLTLVLDLPAAEGLARAAQRRGQGLPDRFEGENLEYHERLRQAFIAIAAAEPDRCALIDASRAEAEVARDIWTCVQTRLHPPNLTTHVGTRANGGLGQS